MIKLNLSYLRKLYIGNGTERYVGDDGKFGNLNDIAKFINIKKSALIFLRDLIKAYPNCYDIKQIKSEDGKNVRGYRFKKDALFEIFRKHPNTKDVILMVTHYDTPNLYSNALTEELNHIWLGNGEEE